MPCMDIFEEQSEEYKAKVLPKNVRKRVAVEALSGFGWDRYVGLDGDIIGMNRFGASDSVQQTVPILRIYRRERSSKSKGTVKM